MVGWVLRIYDCRKRSASLELNSSLLFYANDQFERKRAHKRAHDKIVEFRGSSFAFDSERLSIIARKLAHDLDTVMGEEFNFVKSLHVD